MKRKYIALLTASVLALSLLTGCGAKTETAPAETEAAEAEAADSEEAESTETEETAEAEAEETAAVSGEIISLGTGSAGGTDNVVVEAISSVVNSNTDLKTSTVTTSGGAEIVYLIESGDIQGGYSGTVDLVDALNGEGLFETAVAEENILQAFGFVTWDLPIIVLDSSDIQSYEDLAGKHVGLPPAASSSTTVLTRVLEAYGILDDITIDYFTWAEGYTALKDGRIDAFVGSYANGEAISGIIEIEASQPIRALPLDEEIAQQVNGGGITIGSLTSEQIATIPEGEEVLAAANSGVIIFSADVPEEDVYVYTKTVLEKIEDLKQISAYFEGFDDVVTSVCVENVPFHPGAARALEEAGLWEDRFNVYGE